MVGRAAALLLACLSLAWAAPPTSAALPDLPLDAVRVGQRGYAVTAGPGDTLERFPVEVLGVQNDAGAGFPLVLIRASGPFIEASGGIAAGMSGSPVYLGVAEGDTLLGAIGYVFPSADHRLALVTPIASMRRAAEGGDGPEPGPIAVAGLGRAVPVATPVLLDGLGVRAAALLAPLFTDTRVVPVPVDASGTRADAGAGSVPVPGAAVSVQLLRGDLTIAAVGTLTTVEDDRVLAFGHPLLGRGAVAMALAPASVTAIVPSDVVPFKLVNDGRSILGRIDQDRPAALAGRLGAGPAMIPVTVTIAGAGPTRTYHLEVVPDGRLYGPLVAAATLELVDRVRQRGGAGFAEVAWDLTLHGGQRLSLLDQVDGADDLALAAARLAGAPLQLLADNPFEAPGVSRIALNVRLEAERSTTEIADVVVENPELGPGEPAVVHVRLQPFRREALVRTVSVPLPEGSAGTLTLRLRGGHEPVDDADAPPDPERRPRSFAELLDAMRQAPRGSDLVVELPGEGDAPPTRLARVSLPGVVQGVRTVEVRVRDGGATPSALEPAAPGGTSADPAAPPTPTGGDPDGP